MYGPSNGWWDFGMMLLSLVFLALIVAAVVFVVRSFSQGSGWERRPEGSRALEILDERYARGEIDQLEYEQRRRVLAVGR